MNIEHNNITNEAANFYSNEKGIIIAEYFKEDYTLELDTSIEIVNSISKLTAGKISPCLFIPSKGFSSTNQAREYFVKNLPKGELSALALVLDSLGHKIIGNFFIKVQKPRIPTKIFKTKEDAMVWLASFL